MFSFSYLEPISCSMSSSNCCFLICIQVSQEAGQVVWYSHLFKNIPQFVIHTVKGFGIVNKAERDFFFFWNSCFFNDSADVGNLILGSTVFSKTSLCIWKFRVHVALVIENTFFQQHKRRLYTWTSPDGQHQNQIDYIICSQRWRSSIQSAKTRLGADGGSNHELLIAKFRFKLKKVKSLSCIQLLVTPWTAAYQAPPSRGFPRQEYWSGVSLPSPYFLQLKSEFFNKEFMI